MSDEKRYYWLKLYDDFFDSLRIKRLRKMAGGDTYLIIYLKLQLKAMKNNGILEWKHYYDDVIEELADDINEEPDNVKITLAYLKSCGLAESSDDERFFLPYAVKNVSSEGASAKRMREARANAKLSGDDKTVTLCAQSAEKCEQSGTSCELRYGEIDIDIESDTDIESEPESESDKRARVTERFTRFWSAYPKKVGKGAAEAAFRKIRPSDELTNTMVRVIERMKSTEQWRREKGRFIPNPATWLNQKRWEDDPTPTKPTNPPDDEGYEDWGYA